MTPEDPMISIFAGCLTNHDRAHRLSHSPLTLANFLSINLVFVFRCSSSTTNPVSVSRVDSSGLVF
jgi:hypothetical protein